MLDKSWITSTEIFEILKAETVNTSNGSFQRKKRKMGGGRKGNVNGPL